MKLIEVKERRAIAEERKANALERKAATFEKKLVCNKFEQKFIKVVTFLIKCLI